MSRVTHQRSHGSGEGGTHVTQWPQGSNQKRVRDGVSSKRFVGSWCGLGESARFRHAAAYAWIFCIHAEQMCITP